MIRKFFILVFCFFIVAHSVSAQYVDILTEEEAGQKIIQDEMDGFFEKIRPLDISIQLQDPTLTDASREKAVDALLEALPKDVLTPDSLKQLILRESMERALALSQAFREKYPLPDTIYIGVLKGNLYGAGVFYTRENGIFVPNTMINRQFQSQLTDVLIHEIFHIQSRYYPELQEQLYKEIGFYDLGCVPEIAEPLRSRIMLNPDGTDRNFYIPLSMDGDTVMAYPIIHTNAAEYISQKPEFFQYMQFQLFPLEKTEEGYKVSYGEELKGLDEKWMRAFFGEIEDNTQYIIHPDEVMADNFVLLAKIKSGESHKKLSEEGRKLLERLAAIYEVPLDVK